MNLKSVAALCLICSVSVAQAREEVGHSTDNEWNSAEASSLGGIGWMYAIANVDAQARVPAWPRAGAIGDAYAGSGLATRWNLATHSMLESFSRKSCAPRRLWLRV